MNPAKKPADTYVSPRQEPRLPPGQILTEKWPVLHHGAMPKVNLETWSFQVSGLVTNDVRWSWDEFQALPRVQVESDIHCVTRWSRYNNMWEGVSLREIFRQVNAQPGADFVVLHAEGGYSTNLPLSELLQDDVLLADRHDRKPLTPEHGYPVRLVVPRRYFWKSVKWIQGIKLVDADQPGFWERNGYHNEADPWKEERFSDW